MAVAVSDPLSVVVFVVPLECAIIIIVLALVLIAIQTLVYIVRSMPAVVVAHYYCQFRSPILLQNGRRNTEKSV